MELSSFEVGIASILEYQHDGPVDQFVLITRAADLIVKCDKNGGTAKFVESVCNVLYDLLPQYPRQTTPSGYNTTD